MPESSEIAIVPHDEIVWARLECDRMEEEHAKSMQSAVSAAAEKANGLPVVLDLTRVDTMPSLSIGALVSLWQDLKQKGQRLILAGLRPNVRQTLTVCRLDKIFEITESVDEAVSRVRQGPS